MPRLKKEHLINWFKEGEKKREDWKIGTEHEKFVYKMDSLKPVSYEEESGIRNILMKLLFLVQKSFLTSIKTLQKTAELSGILV